MTPRIRDAWLRAACLAGLLVVAALGLWRTPELASYLAPEHLADVLIGRAENLVVDKEGERDARAALEQAVAVRLAEWRRGLTVSAPDSMITEASLVMALRRAHTLRVEAADDLLRARETLARAKRLRDTGWQGLRAGCPAVGEATP